MPRVPAAQGFMARVSLWISDRRYGPQMRECTASYAHSPRILRWFAAYNRAVEKPVKISKHLGDLAVLKAATVVGCEFCMDIGSEHARRSGLTDEQLLALHRAPESGLFSGDELLVIDYGRAMTVTPPEVTDEQVEALRARFGDDGVLELTHLVAWENTRARTNAALGIGAGGFSAGKVCVALSPGA